MSSRALLTLVRRALIPAIAASTALPLLAAPPAEASYTANGVTVNRFEAAVVSAINSQRSKHGLRALVVAAGPTDVARRWAMRMAAGSQLSHNPNVGSQLKSAGSSWTWMGENVGYGSATNPGALVSAYMASPPHRANILNSRARYLGIGVVDGISSGRRVAWNVLDFTNAYTTAYGHSMEPADAMPYDGGAVTASTTLANFEGAWDPRVRTQRSSTTLAVSRARYSGPTGGDDTASFTVAAARLATAGHADFILRLPLDLRRARSLSVGVSSSNPLSHPVRFDVLVGDGTWQLALGSFYASAAGRTLSVPLPASAKRWVDSVRIRVSGLTLSRLGSSLSQRTATLRLRNISVTV